MTTWCRYGQTGSGKTFTMEGIQERVVVDMFEELKKIKTRDPLSSFSLGVSYFEIYGGRCQDLLHGRRRLALREDRNKEVQIVGLEEIEVQSAHELRETIERGSKLRTTHQTEMNDTSSRSHGLCQITIRRAKVLYGSLSLIDLAGSERGADTKHHNRQRRMESQDINTSLLALKACIRALASGSDHIPFRASNLTKVLKDSFTSRNAK